MALSRVVSEILNFEKYHDLDTIQEPIKVIESGTIQYTGYGFLSVFYSSFVPKIFDFKNAVTLKTGLVVLHGRWKRSIERTWHHIDIL